MDVGKLHNVLMTAAAVGNQLVDDRWFDIDAFVADVSPALENVPRRERTQVRLYRYDNAKPWCKANCFIARPSGPRYATDPGIAIVEVARLRVMQEKAQMQNRYVTEVMEAA